MLFPRRAFDGVSEVAEDWVPGWEGVGEGPREVDAAALVDDFACAWMLFFGSHEV